MNDSIGDIINWISRHKYLFVTLTFLAIIVVFDENSMLRHMQNQREIISIKSEYNELEKQHDDLVIKLNELDTNAAAMEKIARDKYDMHLDNEEIFIIQE